VTGRAAVTLEQAAREFAEATALPPYLFDLGPADGRAVVDEIQGRPVAKPPVDIHDLVIPGGPSGEVPVRIVRPQHAPVTLPVVVYVHGAGWVFGSRRTHDRLIRELATGAEAAVVFPDYSLAPEATYPTAIEECYAVASWVAGHGAEHGLDPGRMAVAGDCAGGCIAIALALLAAERHGVSFRQQVLFYPVTDASFDTGSYEEYATGYFLRRDTMQWFWDQYITDPAQRSQATASPLGATVRQLASLPPTLVITAEADVLRDEGEAFAGRLRQAGVPVTAVRFQGTIHDFVMLNALAGTQAARAALILATGVLRDSLGAARQSIRLRRGDAECLLSSRPGRPPRAPRAHERRASRPASSPRPRAPGGTPTPAPATWSRSSSRSGPGPGSSPAAGSRCWPSTRTRCPASPIMASRSTPPRWRGVTMGRGRALIGTALAVGLLAGCGAASRPSPGPAAAGAAGTPVSAGVETLQQTFVRVIQQVLPSVVEIRTEAGLGSGVVLDRDGDIVTNAHVVAGASSFQVLPASAAPVPAVLVGSCPADDLAVIRVSADAGLRPAAFGDPASVAVGDIVLAIGSPLGLGGSVTEGIVSATGRSITEPASAGAPAVVLADAIQTSAAINPGNSGGSLVGIDGQVIGIPTLAAVNRGAGGAAPGIGFAIPASLAVSVGRQLASAGAAAPSGCHR
jgi:acetyl esterase/lipase/S1-C subfamily serine protease